MKRLSVSLFVSVLLLQGCFTFPWTRTTAQRLMVEEHNVAMVPPADWMLSSEDSVVLLTRDGLLLQYIVIETIHVDDELNHSKKNFSRGMMPLEQAEVILDNMASNEKFLGFKVTKNKPVKVAEHNGFRAEYEYKDTDGLAYRGVVYGFMQNDWFYGVRFVATARHYYERDLSTFEAFVKTIHLLI